MKILVADTDIENRTQIVDLINDEGKEAIEANSGQEVIEHCRGKCPDLLLIDVKLSGIDGAGFVKRLRQLGGHIVWNPIVLMSKNPTEQLFQESVDAGADELLAKPIDPYRLKFLINAANRHIDLKEQVFSVAHELVMANRAMESIGTQDTMTGIHDIHSFHQRLEQEWMNSKKEKKVLSLLFTNIDYFSKYNDIYGSEEGDEVIKKIAVTLRHQLPKKYDMLARTTGDTFAALLPNADSATAQKIAQQLRTAVESLKIPHTGSQCSDHLTVSIGITSTEEQSFNGPLEMMEAADYALYQAKHKGRNQICYVAEEYN